MHSWLKMAAVKAMKYKEKITVFTLTNTDIWLGKGEWEIEPILDPTDAQSLNKEMNC